jgi:hypothetical protein
VDNWNSPDCATGEISSYTVGDEETGQGEVIRLDGWSAVCQSAPVIVPRADLQFGLILYSEHDARIGVLTEYTATPTTFTYHVDSAAQWGSGRIVAVCLAYHEERRLSCLGISLAGSGLSVFPISTSDPLVSRHRPDRECGYCAEEGNG